MRGETYAHIPTSSGCIRAGQITRERNDVKEDCNEELPDMNSPTEEKAGYPGALALDVEKYLPHVEKFDVTDAQKVELLHTLWNIMSAFVDLGWDVNSVPDFLPALREISSDTNHVVLGIADEGLTDKFNDVTARLGESNGPSGD